MAWSVTDLATLEASIATGAVKVRYADGREVTYRSLGEMKAIRAEMQAALGVAQAPRVLLAEHRR